jgi:hypothetical protein
VATKPEVDTRESADIVLDFPFDFDGENVTSITMRRPKVRDKLRAKNTKGDEMDKGMALISNLVERPLEFLMEIDEVDLDKLEAQYMAFTGRTPETDAN